MLLKIVAGSHDFLAFTRLFRVRGLPALFAIDNGTAQRDVCRPADGDGAAAKARFADDVDAMVRDARPPRGGGKCHPRGVLFVVVPNHDYCCRWYRTDFGSRGGGTGHPAGAEFCATTNVRGCAGSRADS